MANQFSSSVDFGLRLSRRIYYGQGPAPAPAMSRSPEEYLPTAPMCYAVISDPDTVDNPDIRSYQPYVHGKCDPPALIPLQLLGVTMEVDCSLDTAFVTVNARWRVHCVLGSSTCDCRLAIPMGEQGSLLGVEVDNFGRSYHTELISRNDENDKEKVAKAKDGYFLKSQIYIIDIPQFSGGSIFSIKIKWSQEILFNEGQFSLNIPFSFPSYVNPIGIKSPKKERILLKVNSGAAREVSCNTSSHPLKVLMRQAGKLSLSYEAEVQAWSSIDFSLSYIVSLTDIVGGVLLQSPFLRDFDEREIFCLYLYLGKSQDRKVFRKNVVFIVDISGSMKGSPLESTKNALIASLSHLDAQDTFNIIAFNGEFYSFSGLMEPATVEKLLSATKWVEATFIANGGTNILNPLTQAMKLFQNSTASDSIPLIFLVTDGTVENERQICNFVKSCLTNGQPVRTPRICTLGIGLHCNHYFLQMLAQIGRGHYDAAFDLDSISFRMQRLFRTASSVIVSDITLGGLGLDSVELFPPYIPDLSLESPLMISGRCNGTFPESVKVTGTLADMTKFEVDLEVQREKDIQLTNILAKRHMDLVTSQAWLLESAELVEKDEESRRYTGDGSVDFKGRPVLKENTGNWRACPFILGNECCERLAYYGIATNLVTYLTTKLHEGNVSAARNVTTWQGTCYLTPLIGAVLADAYWGRYWTIAGFSMIYFIGMCTLTLSASVPALKPAECVGSICPSATPAQYAVFFFGLYMIALGTGGIKPCVSSFGADQFDDTDSQERIKKGSFFNWFYFSINIGALVSSSLIVWIQENRGWGLGFGIPALFMGLAIGSFFIGTPLYRFQKPGGSPITRMCQVVVASFQKRNLAVPEDSSLLYETPEKTSAIEGSRKLGHSDELRCLDRAAVVSEAESKTGNYSNPWRLCTVTQVEELKILIRMFPVWATGIIFAAVYAQMSTLFVEQGTMMDTTIGSFSIPPASLSTFDVISVIFWVPVYDRVIVPIARKFTGKERGFTELQRMGIGLFISILCMSAAAVVEIVRLQLAKELDLVDKPVAVPLSIFWQIPQYFLLGAAEVFTFVGQLEFFYDQSPDAMRSLCSALSLLTTSLGNYLSSFILTVVTYLTTQGGKPGWIPNNLNEGHLDNFFWLLAGLSLLNMLVYIVAAKRYKQKKAT